VLQFSNETPYAGTILLMPDPDGIDSVYAVVKATFTLDEMPGPADVQLPIVLADIYHGEPGQSSIRVPSDVGLVKPGTDLLVIGHAWAPDGLFVTQMDVALRCGPLQKTVRVFGDRVWESGQLGGVISPAAPFQAMPLVWERAFGGVDWQAGQPAAYPRNPAGTGYHAHRGDWPVEGIRLPNLEDPSAPISSWKQTPPPAGFGPICAHWEPRASYAGTYDEAWQKGRAPFLPDDFDSRFCQLAPPDQVVSGYLRGGELVEIWGMTPSGFLQFTLPSVQLSITYVLDGNPLIRPTNLDTVIIEPDANRLTLVWRTGLQCDKKARRVNEVRASESRPA
jgi:hypothetical protein